MNISLFTRNGVFLLLAMPLAFAARSSAQEPKPEKTESRNQSVLKINGEFTPNGNELKVLTAPTSGPGANMEMPNAAIRTRGILDAGDVITAIEGKPFKGRRDFFDQMNAAHVKNNGVVRITVKDVGSGKSMEWIVRPDVVRMDVPVAVLDFLAELGKPVPAAPPVPLVPATIDR